MDIKDEIIAHLKSVFIGEKFKSEYKYIEENENAIVLNLLKNIRDVIQNDELSDFDAIEEIVCLFERYGIDCGGRHDF